MHRHQEPGYPWDRVLFLFLLALLLFASPLRLWWAEAAALWYAPYLVWLLVIGLTALLQRWLRRHAV